MTLLDDLPTPCLLVDRARLRRNLEQMQARADEQGVALRPHVKTHKSTALARRQQVGGARGLTVATVHEAEVFAAAGFDDLRVAYCVVGTDKHERLLALHDRAHISFCVDTIEGVRAAGAFYAQHNRTADVLLEVDVGHGRCGVAWDGSEGVALAQAVAAQEGLRLVGLLTHAGQAYRGPQEATETPEAALLRASRAERDRLLTLAQALHTAEGLGVTPESFVLSIGSTPTMTSFANRTAGGFGITEIRPGNYVFNDRQQVALASADPTDCALTVLATVVSKHRDRAGRERLYLDAGKKVLTTDTGYGIDDYGQLLYDPVRRVPHPHARLTGLSEEHGWAQVRGGATYAVGDRVQVVPNHACVTVATQDRLYLVDGDEVAGTLTIDAR